MPSPLTQVPSRISGDAAIAPPPAEDRLLDGASAGAPTTGAWGELAADPVRLRARSTILVVRFDRSESPVAEALRAAGYGLVTQRLSDGAALSMTLSKVVDLVVLSLGHRESPVVEGSTPAQRTPWKPGRTCVDESTTDELQFGPAGVDDVLRDAASAYDGGVFDQRLCAALQIVRELRAHPASRHKPLLVTSATALAKDERLRLLNAGASDVTGPEAGSAETLARIRQALRRTRVHDRLQRQDALTRLANRAEFFRRVDAVLEGLRSSVGSATSTRRLMLIDIDQFKQINDHFGTVRGDEILRQVAQRLTAFIAGHGGQDRRQEGTLSPWTARIDSDRFMVLVPGAPGDPLHDSCIHRITDVFDEPFDNGQIINLSATIGVASFPDDGPTAEILTRHAEMAVSIARQRGRSTVEFFSTSKHFDGTLDWPFQNDLRHAIDRGELSLCYQPQVDVRTRRTVAVEALLRWSHPLRGNVSPSVFVPAAERSGFIDRLGDWVVAEACRQAARWEALGLELPVAINLSPSQFLRGDVRSLVLDALRTHGVKGSRLTFEITEGVLMEQQPAVIETLKQLKKLGVRLSLDDFGTGYSSMAYLRRFPVDEIKIDRSFMRGLPGRRSNRAIVDALLALARGLQLRVVAEGIEKETQIGPLLDQSDLLLQGSLFGLALRADDITKRLQSEASQPNAVAHGPAALRTEQDRS